jgi:hypothetical protein
MGAHRNKWNPDTCGCVVEFEFDDALPAEDRKHELHTVHQKCKAHESLTDEQVWKAVHVENIRKNKSVDAAVKHLKAAGVSIEPVDVAYAFTDTAVDSARALEISLPLLEAKHRKSVTDELAKVFGSDVVVK